MTERGGKKSINQRYLAGSCIRRNHQSMAAVRPSPNPKHSSCVHTMPRDSVDLGHDTFCTEAYYLPHAVWHRTSTEREWTVSSEADASGFLVELNEWLPLIDVAAVRSARRSPVRRRKADKVALMGRQVNGRPFSWKQVNVVLFS